MEKTDKFVVRCYGKSELAEMYFPDLRREAAGQKLKRWIRKCSDLSDELNKEEYGYRMQTRAYSAREVKLIVHYLGEPF